MDRGMIFVKNPDASSRIYDGRALVVLSGDAELKVLNDIGSLVWERLDGRTTLGDLVDAVVEEYDVTPAEAERDILEFIASLRDQNMVR